MTSLIAFLTLIGVLITAHEFGHFIVAKLCGVKVHTFSVGFGQAVLSKTIGETEYRIALLPLGGYVRLHGMEREFGESEFDSLPPNLYDTNATEDPDRGRALQDKPAWMRVLIFLAGPLMNLILPFALLPPLFFNATQYDQVIDNRMGAVDEGLPAYKAGLRDGDQITQIDGDSIYAFWQVQEKVNRYQKGTAPLKVIVERPYTQERFEVYLSPEEVASTERFALFERRPPRIGFQPASLSADYLIVNHDLLFAQSGGKSFDRVIAFNGQQIDRHSDFVGMLATLIQQHSAHNLSPNNAELSIKVERLTPLDTQLRFLRKKESYTLQISLIDLIEQVGVIQASDERVQIKEGVDSAKSVGSSTSPHVSQPKDLSTLALQALGLRQASACISSIDPKSAAAQVLQVGDCLLAVDQSRHSLAVFFEQRLRYKPEQIKEIKVLRKGKEVVLKLRLREETHHDPLAGEVKFWQLGFTLSGLSKVGAMIAPTRIENHRRAEFSWAQTTRQVSSEFTRSIHSLAGLFSGQVSPTQLSGPITIFYIAGQQAEAGWIPFINLMVLISLSIALLNLLPVPGLDGGHILFSSLEMITGRPLPSHIRAHIQTVGVLLILCLILFALGNDVLRMWRLSQGG